MMVPTTRSDDSAALEHILAVIFNKSYPIATSTSIPSFRACFTKAGVSNASDLISMDPSDYGLIFFALDPFGNEDRQLNYIQVKKLNSLFSWFRQDPSATVSHWLTLDYQTFQSPHTSTWNNSVPFYLYHL